MTRVNIFYDFDGVFNFFGKINAENSNFFDNYKTTKVVLNDVSYSLNWSQEMVDYLLNLQYIHKYNWLWLTTWVDNISAVNNALNIETSLTIPWATEPYVMPWGGYSTNIQEYRNEEKLRLVRLYAQANPENPFVWVDDEATKLWGETEEQEVKQPHLIITTNPNTGLTKKDIQNIENFLQDHSL